MRYYLDAFGYAKVSGGGRTIAVATFAGGVTAGDLEAKRSNVAHLLKWPCAATSSTATPGGTLGDLLDKLVCKMDPPQPED